ncbi:tryptophan dimethylallyltransferase family protein [Streptomyces sp. DH24]|uniref:tryptophan dimethylallyltransferase family protein n=1 Tax=Streptomyces sp. DH24 TaxID=3040123 RepID=UPI00244289C1|nr:tryptophan dimethylallyltransferase family protein [Streptomyces sp. DH24]MDG9715870.1 tryptophan dimethylallyltransferase family protein [Streptomyces sp. DH24]
MDHISTDAAFMHDPIEWDRTPAPTGGCLLAPRKVPDGTLGGLTAGQLSRLCDVAGLDPGDTRGYVDAVVSALGGVAGRPLDLPPATATFLSDDHTPVEYSLSFTPGEAPVLRVLLDPGCGADSLARGGRVGLDAVRRMARRWNFSTDRLDELADLFLPPDPHGPLALWCALELRPGGTPKVKVYLNPAARGAKRSAETVREALRRLGHRHAFDTLPPADRFLFFALDLGDWDEPRAKVYLAHQDVSAGDAAALSRTADHARHAEFRTFFRTVTGVTHDGPDGDAALFRRPFQSCHAFTETASGLPSGFTLYVPVRDHARHDGEALERAVTVLEHHGMDPGPLIRAVPAVTGRRLTDGVGLVAYVSLAHQQGRPPRVTVYVSAEAYRVRPPNLPAPQPEAVH